MASFYYSNPSLGAGLSNLAEALFPDPLQDVKAGVLGAQRRQAEADAVKTGLEADQLRRAQTAQFALSNLFAPGAADDPAFWSNVYRQGAFMGADGLQHLPGYAASFAHTPGSGLSNPEALAQLIVGSGGDYADTQIGFREGQATEIQKAHIGVGPQYHAANLLNERERWKMLNPTLELAAGNTAIMPPAVAGNLGVPQVYTAPEAYTLGENETRFDPSNTPVAAGARTLGADETSFMAPALAELFGMNPITENPDLTPPGGAGGFGTEDEARINLAIGSAIENMLGGADTIPVEVAAVIPAVRSRATQIYRETGDMNLAVNQALAEHFQITPGEDGGWFGSDKPPGLAPIPPGAAAPALSGLESTLQQAREAIAAGADPAAVAQRLLDMGIDPSGL